MSTKWGKHTFCNIEKWDDELDCSVLMWHVVVLGQKSLTVEAPIDFPCWRHRAAIDSLIEELEVQRFSYAQFWHEDGEWSLWFADDLSQQPALRCSLWAPLIDERELHVTEWINAAVRLATWKGVEVVIKAGISRVIDDNREIAAQSEAYRYLQDTDLTPKFLGHLHRRGVVIGFVLEALIGRHPLPTDEDYEACSLAVQKLYGTGTVHCDLNRGNIIITEHGVRFVDIVLGACDPANSRNRAIRDVDFLFDPDGEVARFPKDASIPTPPRRWSTGAQVDWEIERRFDVKLYGECPPLPPVRKAYMDEDLEWRNVPLVPYCLAFKPYNTSEVGWPATLEGHTHSPLTSIYRQFLAPGYLALQLPYLPPGELPGAPLHPLLPPSVHLPPPETD